MRSAESVRATRARGSLKGHELAIDDRVGAAGSVIADDLPLLGHCSLQFLREPCLDELIGDSYQWIVTHFFDFLAGWCGPHAPRTGYDRAIVPTLGEVLR